jgi:hypothetical protein
MSKESTLTSLAMLKVNIDGGKDYLEYLRPFILDILANCAIEVINDAAVSEKLRARFGLEIPRRTVQILLQRLVKSGVLKKSQGVFRIIGEIPGTNIAKEKAEAERHISAVANGLIEYQKNNVKMEMDEEVAMDALLTFLSKFSIPCLKAYLRGTAIPTSEDGQEWKIILVSQYVMELQKTNPERFDSFITMAQGNMLANALLCPDLQEVSDSYNNVVFFFDTPMLLKLLGLEGDPSKQAIVELVDLIDKLKGKVACFAHTYDELVGVIKSCANYVDKPEGSSAIVQEAKKKGLSKSDLLLIAGNSEDVLLKAKIVFEPTPRYTKEFQIDQKAFETILKDEVHYHNPRAPEYDVNSVRSIYVLRKGNIAHSIEKCGAVFVTSNEDFSIAACKYGKDEESSMEISSVITDFSLANTAWLKAPQGAPGLPRKEVLAFAYAAMKPSPSFWDKVLKEADKLVISNQISARGHQLLRSSVFAQEEMMRLTLGEEKSLTPQTFSETIRRVTDDIKAEETAKLTMEEQAHSDTSSRLQALLEEREKLIKQIYWRCENKAERRASIITLGVSSMFVAILLIGAMITRISLLSGIALIIAATVPAFFPILRYFGFEFRHKTIKERITGWLLKRCLKKESTELGIREVSDV